jgi:hypothetical protein
MTKKDYNQTANDFLYDTGVKMEIIFKEYGSHFPKDTDKRDIYTVTLSKGQRKYIFDFGNSINASGTHFLYGNYKKGVARSLNGKAIIQFLNPIYKGVEGKAGDSIHNFRDWEKNPNYSIPSEYDVLACLTKYDPGTFEYFCNDFGYDTDSRTAENIYKAVLNEWKNVCILWTDREIEKLQEIQ